MLGVKFVLLPGPTTVRVIGPEFSSSATQIRQGQRIKLRVPVSIPLESFQIEFEGNDLYQVQASSGEVLDGKYQFEAVFEEHESSQIVLQHALIQDHNGLLCNCFGSLNLRVSSGMQHVSVGLDYQEPFFVSSVPVAVDASASLQLQLCAAVDAHVFMLAEMELKGVTETTSTCQFAFQLRNYTTEQLYAFSAKNQRPQLKSVSELSRLSLKPVPAALQGVFKEYKNTLQFAEFTLTASVVRTPMFCFKQIKPEDDKLMTNFTSCLRNTPDAFLLLQAVCLERTQAQRMLCQLQVVDEKSGMPFSTAIAKLSPDPIRTEDQRASAACASNGKQLYVTRNRFAQPNDRCIWDGSIFDYLSPCLELSQICRASDGADLEQKELHFDLIQPLSLQTVGFARLNLLELLRAAARAEATRRDFVVKAVSESHGGVVFIGAGRGARRYLEKCGYGNLEETAVSLQDSVDARLLGGKFVPENLGISGIAINTGETGDVFQREWGFSSPGAPEAEKPQNGTSPIIALNSCDVGPKPTLREEPAACASEKEKKDVVDDDFDTQEEPTQCKPAAAEKVPEKLKEEPQRKDTKPKTKIPTFDDMFAMTAGDAVDEQGTKQQGQSESARKAKSVTKAESKPVQPKFQFLKNAAPNPEQPALPPAQKRATTQLKKMPPKEAQQKAPLPQKQPPKKPVEAEVLPRRAAVSQFQRPKPAVNPNANQQIQNTQSVEKPTKPVNVVSDAYVKMFSK